MNIFAPCCFYYIVIKLWGGKEYGRHYSSCGKSRHHMDTNSGALVFFMQAGFAMVETVSPGQKMQAYHNEKPYGFCLRHSGFLGDRICLIFTGTECL
jgi:hypothetical protein